MLRNPGITVVVCEYCTSTLYREGDVLAAGKKSIVGEPRSNLAVGARGQIGGLDLEIVGRVRFDHGQGSWDEWYAVDSGGRDHWVVEDERSYALERPGGNVDLVLGEDGTPALGDVVRHMGTDFQVDEIGTAICLGGEGMLPRHIQPGETYRFVDLTEVGGDRILAIELTDPPEAYVGRAVPPADVDFPPREAPVAGHPDAGPIVQASSIGCGSCGSAVQLSAQGESAQTTTCTSCGAVLHLDGAQAKVVGRNESEVGFPFAVGDRATFDDAQYEVMGRMLYVEMDGSTTREYLLWSEAAGYLWLEEYERHYTQYRPTQVGPKLSDVRSAGPNQKVDCGEHTYRFFESGITQLRYVDGALPWLAQQGDTQDYYTLIAPPRVYSVEISEGREMERFAGTWIHARDVFEAFGKGDRYQVPIGVGAGQPNPVGATGRWTMRLLLLFGALNMFIACGTLGAGTALMQSDVGAADLKGEVSGARVQGTWVSEPFQVPTGSKVLGMHYDTNVSNDWAAVTASLLAGDNTPVGALDSEIEYYSGRDHEGSWSEGSRQASSFALAPPPGEYRVMLSVDARRDVHVRVRVTVGDKLTRWPLLLGIALLVLGFIIFFRRAAFEQARHGIELDD